jgi:repressor LexA
MAITRRQRQIIDYLQTFIDEHGYSPSFAEMAEGLGLRSMRMISRRAATSVHRRRSRSPCTSM